MSVRRKPRRCARKGCKRPLTPYRPPTKDVPLAYGVDPYCSRSCAELAYGVTWPERERLT